MSGHTRGPWYTEPSNFADGLEVTADARQHMIAIATIPTGYDEPVESEQRANAQLIAASPDLYDALQFTVSMLQIEAQGHQDSGDEHRRAYVKPLRECIQRARAVLAAAVPKEGE